MPVVSDLLVEAPSNVPAPRCRNVAEQRPPNYDRSVLSGVNTQPAHFPTTTTVLEKPRFRLTRSHHGQNSVFSIRNGPAKPGGTPDMLIPLSAVDRSRHIAIRALPNQGWLCGPWTKFRSLPLSLPVITSPTHKTPRRRKSYASLTVSARLSINKPVEQLCKLLLRQPTRCLGLVSVA
ncbi:hypothetical protein BJX61DRAFT_435511 [Aspergillus egyptiacus]|nr:hypothetical protein BJX61DRAFT_435511 [Aspergillus egyptiacus]